MLGFGGVKLEVRTRFVFDRKHVMDSVEKSKLKVLSRCGAFVMTTARGLIRHAKNWNDYSKPGRPPKSHLGLLKKLIVFAWEPRSRSVVIGPTRLNQRDDSAPALLEFGGEAIRTKRMPERQYVAHYEPRPYMGPALEKNVAKFPTLFENSIVDKGA